MANELTKKISLSRCYISPKLAGEVDGSGNGMGEGFFINKLSDTTAEVCNNCMCGLCVGDIINIKTYPDDGVHHPHEFVSIKERKAKAFHLYYNFKGMDKVVDKMPKEINDFINKLQEENEIRFEGMVKGVAAMSYPITMSDANFFKKINSGPMKFSRRHL